MSVCLVGLARCVCVCVWLVCMSVCLLYVGVLCGA